MTELCRRSIARTLCRPCQTAFNQFGWYYDTHLKNHYSTQYDLEIQKQLNQSLVATVGYVGKLSQEPACYRHRQRFA